MTKITRLVGRTFPGRSLAFSLPRLYAVSLFRCLAFLLSRFFAVSLFGLYRLLALSGFFAFSGFHAGLSLALRISGSLAIWLSDVGSLALLRHSFCSGGEGGESGGESGEGGGESS